MNQIAGLGWRRDLESREELHRTAVPFCMVQGYTAPEKIDHRAWLKVENQKVMGSCAGQAISTIQEVLNYIATGGKIVQLSRMFGYLAAQRGDGGSRGDTGAMISGAIKGAMTLGCCPEELFPYPCDVSPCSCRETCQRYTKVIPAEALEVGKLHLARRHSVLKSYADCFKWLASGVGAIEIGILWTAGLANKGVIEVSDLSGDPYGGHALAVVGYSERKDSQGRNYLWLVNSHSERWGNKGWAEVAPACFDRWGWDDGSELIGLTDLMAFSPRTVPTYVGMVA